MLRNLLLICLGLTLCNARLDAQELINWHEDLSQARQIAQQYKVPLLIHFYGDNCVPCKTLEKNVFTRPEVASTMQRYFVPVHINATRDRRTAAQYGVHSWPTDVFVSPDGKTLTQGVCNQNPNTYLQNLQSVAVMNRDRNLMLAGNPQPDAQTARATQQPPGAQQQAGAAFAAATSPNHTGNPYAASQVATQPTAQPLGQSLGQHPAQPPAGQAATVGAPYGRLATTSLQQHAPGRDQAPAPYDNPSSGAGPYASPASSASLPPVSQSSLPSPTWSGQSAHGQAASGLANSGPLSGASSMTLAAATPGTSQDHKDVNLPQSAQWQPGTHQQRSNPAATAPTLPPNLSAGAALAVNPALASAPTMPPPATLSPASKPATAATAGAFSNKADRPVSQGSVVDNPHFLNGSPNTPAQGPAVGKGPEAHMVSANGSADQRTSVAQPKETASVPALSGYCPVALHTSAQWIEGQPQHAIRHRGRVYLLSSPEAAQQFLAAPDTYSPVLSGYDPLVLLRDGTLVEGSVYTGLKDATQNRIMLFSSPENKKYFQDNYDRLANELDNVLKPAEPLTATGPTNHLQR